MAIDWNRLQKQKEGEASNNNIDWNKLTDRLPTPAKTPTPQPQAGTSMPDALTNTRNLFQGGKFQAFDATTQPYKEIDTRKSQMDPFSSMKGPMTDINKSFDTAQSTPAFDPGVTSTGPLDSIFQAAVQTGRIGSTALVTPIALGVNSIKKREKRIPASEVINNLRENLKDDIASGYATATRDKLADRYMNSQDIKGFEDVRARDVAVLSGIYLADIFGDIDSLLGIGAVTNVLKWGKVGSKTKTLPKGTKITGGSKEFKIAENLKIKTIPKKNKLVVEGYLRRGSEFGDIVRKEADDIAAKSIADKVSDIVGTEVKGVAKGNNLELIAKQADDVNKLKFGVSEAAPKTIESLSDSPVVNELSTKIKDQINEAVKNNPELNGVSFYKKIGEDDVLSGVTPGRDYLNISEDTMRKDIVDLISKEPVSVGDYTNIKNLEDYSKAIVDSSVEYLDKAQKEFVKSLDKAGKELLEKAKKYESADEFIEAQTLYRGQPEGFKFRRATSDVDASDNILIGKGVFTTTDRKIAETYGKNILEFKKPTEQILDISNASIDDLKKLGIDDNTIKVYRDTLKSTSPATIFGQTVEFDGKTYKVFRKVNVKGKTMYELQPTKYGERIINKSIDEIEKIVKPKQNLSNIKDAEDILMNDIIERFTGGKSVEELLAGGSSEAGKLKTAKEQASKWLNKKGYNFVKHQGGIRAGSENKLHDVYIGLSDEALKTQTKSQLKDIYQQAQKGGDAIETVIFNPDKIKTKDQLQKIYNQGQKLAKKSSSKIQASKTKYKVEKPKRKVEARSEYKKIETPELYRLAKNIGEDNLSITLNSRKEELQGFFKPDAISPELSLNRKMFELKKGETDRERQARIAKTFAHEIGHYIDYLPSGTLKRGNIVGRLLSLSDFRKNFIGAEEDLKEVSKIKRKISEINRDKDLTPDEKTKEINKLNKKLIDLSKKIRFDNKEFTKELTNLSHEWRPWQKGVDASYDAYRKSAPELYADFISVLFNEPDLAKDVAPRFYHEFFRNLDKKEKVLKNFIAIQDELMGSKEGLMESRWRMMKDSGLKAQEMYSNMINEKLASNKYPYKAAMIKELWYKHYWAKDVSKKTEYGMEVFDRGQNNQVYLTFDKYFRGIFNDLKKAGLDSNDLSSMLNLQRIKSDITRYNVANVKGIDSQSASDILKDIKKIVGEKEAGELYKAANKMRDALKETMLKYPDLWTPDQMKVIQSSKYYAPFNILYSLSDNAVDGFKKSYGNIDKDFNSTLNILMRTRSTVMFGEKNYIKKNVIDELLGNKGGDIRKAKKNVFEDTGGRLHVTYETPKKDEGLVKIMRNGKSEGYIVPKDIAESIQGDTVRELGVMFRALKNINKPFKALYTELSPGFQVANFAFRDWGSTAQFFEPEWVRAQLGKGNNAGDVFVNNFYRWFYSKGTQAKYYKKAMPQLWNKNKHNIFTPTVKDSLKANIIEVDGRGFFKMDPKQIDDEVAVKQVLEQNGIIEESKRNIFQKTRDNIRAIGQTLEETAKLATYMYFDDIGLMARDEEKYAHIIRNYVGSPNFWKSGSINQEISSVALFYNAILRGVEANYKLAATKDVAGKGSRNAFWWRALRVAVIPQLALIAAEEGAFDNENKPESERLSSQVKKVTEYFKMSYHVIPLGVKENGNAKFISLPLDESTRFLNGITRIIVKSSIGAAKDGELDLDGMGQLLAYTGGQIPSPAPTIKISRAWGTAMTGGNPYDAFKEQHVFSPYQLDNLSKGQKAKIMLKWTANQSGLVKLNMYDSVDNRELDEKIIANIPGINRLYRSTQYGEYEMITDDRGIANEKLRQSQMKNKEVIDIVEDIHKGELNNEQLQKRVTDLAVQRAGYDEFDRIKSDQEIMKEVNRDIKSLYDSIQEKYIISYSNSRLKAIAAAGSSWEKEARMLNIYEKLTISNEEFNKIMNDALMLNIISEDSVGYVSEMVKQTDKYKESLKK